MVGALTQGVAVAWRPCLPWAGMSRPFGVKTRPCSVRVPSVFRPCSVQESSSNKKCDDSSTKFFVPFVVKNWVDGLVSSVECIFRKMY